jgi:hypothetical protein
MFPSSLVAALNICRRLTVVRDGVINGVAAMSRSAGADHGESGVRDLPYS